MSDDKPSKKPTVAALSAEVDTLTELVHQLTESVQRLNARITLMEQELDPQALEALRKQMEILSVAKPPDLRALSADEVREVIKVNPNAPLEVLADWKQAHYTFAAGAILTMLANSMMPEAYEHGGKLAGLVTVLGFSTAVVVALLEKAAG